MNAFLVFLMALLAIWLWHKGTWTEEDEFNFRQSRKDFFDDYSPAERKAMACEDARHKEREEEAARFWAGGN